MHSTPQEEHQRPIHVYDDRHNSDRRPAPKHSSHN